jgi:hypothetical protein
MEKYGNKNKSPQLLNDESFSPSEIVEAMKQGNWAEIFSKVGDKLTTPFLNIPQNGTSLDVRRLGEVTAGSVQELFLRFQPPKGMEAIITGYGVFSDAQFASTTEFIPLLDGRRIFPYHGTPTDIQNPKKLPYRISLGLAPDLSNEALIEVALRVKENQVFEWKVTNTSGTNQSMGVRFKGYLRPVSKQRDYKLGG